MRIKLCTKGPHYTIKSNPLWFLDFLESLCHCSPVDLCGNDESEVPLFSLAVEAFKGEEVSVVGVDVPVGIELGLLGPLHGIFSLAMVSQHGAFFIRLNLDRIFHLKNIFLFYLCRNSI